MSVERAAARNDAGVGSRRANPALGLVLTVAAAWLTRHSPGRWHEWIGYTTLAIVAVRAIWGFFGSRYARFADFVRPASRRPPMLAICWHAGRRVTSGTTRSAGGWSSRCWRWSHWSGLTGWLYTTDRFWGIAWVEELHSTLSDILFAFVGLHLLGIVFTSVRHRENLPAAMLHGRKRNEDVDDNLS